jgi:predicted DNA-binding transcriptional regulator AlpA
VRVLDKARDTDGVHQMTLSPDRLSEKPSLVEILKTKPAFDEEEAALYTSTSVSYLRKGREGTLPDDSVPTPPFIKIGRSVRYLREDLDAWLARFKKFCNRAERAA